MHLKCTPPQHSGYNLQVHWSGEKEKASGVVRPCVQFVQLAASAEAAHEPLAQGVQVLPARREPLAQAAGNTRRNKFVGILMGELLHSL